MDAFYQLIDAAAFLVVLLAGVWFIFLAGSSLFLPERTAKFLESFASSAFAHYLEMSIRLAVGAAFVRFAGQMPFPIVFTVFGWLLIATTICLFAVPWQWHRHFAQLSIPHVVRRLKLFAAVSFILGTAVLAALFMGP